MKSKTVVRGFSLLILLISLLPFNTVNALAPAAPPPADMFQLPWDQGIAWYAIDGIDNGSKRPASSSHNFRLGGAIDFAPRTNMVTGENTSNFWVAAAASGTVVATSTCYVTLSHANGWVTQYQFLANIQVKLGDSVARNQRLGIIADGVKYKYCPGYEEINVPHVHFMLRPSVIGASLAGWEVKYNSFFNSTTFTRNVQTVGLRSPLMNVMDAGPTPSPTPTGTTLPPTSTSTPPSGPYVSTVTDLLSINVDQSATVTVHLNNVPAEGYTSAEFTCPYNASLGEASNIVFTNLFGSDPVTAVNGPQNGSFIAAVAGTSGNKATTSGDVFSFQLKGLQAGQIALDCTARVSTGNNQLSAIPSVGTSITIIGLSPTPVPSSTSTAIVEPPPPTFTPIGTTPAPTLTASPPPYFPTLTPDGSGSTPMPSSTPGGDWLTFLNSTYGFMFGHPGQIVDGRTDNYARINLPFVQGTNLVDKYLEVIVAEGVSTCQSPLATSSILQSSETVVISGIPFLKQTGGDAGAGNLHQWVAYSTSRGNACVSLDFVLHSLNPGNFSTPPPVFDYAAESLVFGQIASTYSWLTVLPTSTSTPATVPPATGSPTATPTPASVASPTLTFTSTPGSSPTPSSGNAAIVGQITASKPVVINVYDQNATLVGTVTTDPDGRFQIEVPPGTSRIVAVSQGFLQTQATETIASGITRFLPPVALLAGDIDGNGAIDQFDALTIGMNYNAVSPAVADLNGDAIINVLDLEALARNYHKTGPIPWQ